MYTYEIILNKKATIRKLITTETPLDLDKLNEARCLDRLIQISDKEVIDPKEIICIERCMTAKEYGERQRKIIGSLTNDYK